MPAKIGKNCRIHPSVLFFNEDEIDIGDNVRIDAYCVLSGPIKIGSYVHLGAFTAKYGAGLLTMEDFTGTSSRVAIYTACGDFSGEFLPAPLEEIPEEYRGGVVAAVTIEAGAIVGTNSTVMPGVTVGRGSAVGAHTLVTNNVHPFWIVGPRGFLGARKKNQFELMTKVTGREI